MYKLHMLVLMSFLSVDICTVYPKKCSIKDFLLLKMFQVPSFRHIRHVLSFLYWIICIFLKNEIFGTLWRVHGRQRCRFLKDLLINWQLTDSEPNNEPNFTIMYTFMTLFSTWSKTHQDETALHTFNQLWQKLLLKTVLNDMKQTFHGIKPTNEKIYTYR